MNIEDLRKLLKETDNKYSILSDLETLIPYNITIGNLEDLIEEFLTDEEIANILKEDIIKGFKPFVKKELIKRIKKDDIKLKIFNDKDAMLGLKDYDITEIVSTLENDKKLQFLKTLEKDYQGPQISENYLYGIIKSLDKDSKKTLLYDKNLLKNTLKLQDIEIINLICEVEDKDKLPLGNLYAFDKAFMFSIVNSLSDDKKKKFIIENPYGYNDIDITAMLYTLKIETIVDIMKNNQEFLRHKKIKPYQLARRLSVEEQLKLIDSIEDINLSLNEKRKIFASLSPETKQRIDKSRLPNEYKLALEVEIGTDIANYVTYGKVIIDFGKDLEIYRGLDELIIVNALTIK